MFSQDILHNLFSRLIIDLVKCSRTDVESQPVSSSETAIAASANARSTTGKH